MSGLASDLQGGTDGAGLGNPQRHDAAADLLAGNFVSIGWDQLGDLDSVGHSQAEISAALQAGAPDEKPGSIAQQAGSIRRFVADMAEGDLIVAPSKSGTYNIGRVAGPYEFHPNETQHRHRRSIEWLVRDAPKDQFTQSAQSELASMHTVFRVANHVYEIERALEGDVEPGSEATSATEQVRYGLLQRTTLEILRDESPQPRRDVVIGLESRINLSDHELSVHQATGNRRFESAITWGSVDMAAAGWITKSSAGWAITDAGRNVLAERPNDDLAKLSGKAYREAQQRKRREAERFKAPSYRIIDEAVKLVGEGQWTSYTDIAEVAGTNAPTVGEYVHAMELDGNHRVMQASGIAYRDEWRAACEAEGLDFDERGVADERRRISAEDLREQLDEIGVLPKAKRRGWLVRGSNIGGQDLVPTWRAEGFVSVSASSLRQVGPGVSRDDLKAIVDEDHAHAAYSTRSEIVDAVHAFLSRVQVGDTLATVDRGRVLLGRVAGDPETLVSPDGESLVVRQVEWVGGDGVALRDVPASLTPRLKVQRDVVDLTRHLDKLETLFGLDAAADPEIVAAEVSLKPGTQDLADQLHVPIDWVNEVFELLNDRPQLIFYGPPGTGKTFLAQALARFQADDNVENVQLVQFHPSYAYEDFLEGFRPTETGGFALRPGPMRRIAEKAVDNPNVPYFLIIDEINRGNLAKVFGELYFLLEYRDENVKLLYSDDDFALPKNVYIIGTMNTADRSIALVDAAMRRRFAFLPLHPTEQPTAGILRSWLKAEGKPSRIADLHEELNRRISDADFKIGPSYFMRAAVHEPGGLERAWRTAILPLLEEHHFGDLDAAEVGSRYGLDEISGYVDGAAAVIDELALEDAPLSAD